jgi:hypothetical protein
VSLAARAAAALLAAALLASATAVAAPRVHRLRVPPPPPLPTSLAVDEREWSIVPSQRRVAAGEVILRVYNRGMDDHDLVIDDALGVAHRVDLAPGESGVIRATLTPGLWTLRCSLFAGTPESHELLGMVTTIRAARDPARVTRWRPPAPRSRP